MKSDTVVLIMTGSPTRAIHVRQKPCTHGLADADIVSAFPLPFNTFQENINTLRQTSRHDIPSTVGILCFWVYAKKLSCEILNLLQITHKKMNMGLYGKICLSDTQFLQNEYLGASFFPIDP